MQQYKRIVSKIVIVLLIGVALLVGYNIWYNSSLRLVNTSPSLTGLPDVIPYIDFNFNLELANNGLSVTSNPAIISRFTIESKDLRVYLMAMTPNQSYKIIISNLRSGNNKLFSQTFNFKATNISFSKLTPAEKSEIIDDQDPNNPSLVSNNPLLAHLPYGGPGYNMTGVIGTTDGQPSLTIDVNIIFDDADYAASPQVLQSRISQREQAAVNYIKSLNLNPSNYNIQYNVPSVP